MGLCCGSQPRQCQTAVKPDYEATGGITAVTTISCHFTFWYFLILLFSCCFHGPSHCHFPFHSFSLIYALFLSLCSYLKAPPKQYVSSPARRGKEWAHPEQPPPQQNCPCVMLKPASTPRALQSHSHVGQENEMCLHLITLQTKVQRSMWCWALINHPFNQISQQREMLSNWQ